MLEFLISSFLVFSAVVVSVAMTGMAIATIVAKETLLAVIMTCLAFLSWIATINMINQLF